MKNRLTVATYNLHGVQENDCERFPQIAKLLFEAGIDICGFQEVINGAGVEDTGYQTARYMEQLSGKKWSNYWQYCHLFFDRYPEGISIMTCHPILDVSITPLDIKFKKKSPLMPRFALTAKIDFHGREVLFTTTHLDHHPIGVIRTLQADRIIQNFKSSPLPHIVTGDLNAPPRSACIQLFKLSGFKDSYRAINKTGGESFPACSPSARIDYILSKKLKPTSSMMLPANNELSDHVGILSSFELDA